MKRFKSIEEIKTALDRFWSFDDNQQHTHTWHDKQDFLSRLSLTAEAMELREKNGGWISVKERLPEEGQLVDVWDGEYVNPSKYQYKEFGRYPNHTNQDRAISYNYSTTTHWRPRPTPPTEGI